MQNDNLNTPADSIDGPLEPRRPVDGQTNHDPAPESAPESDRKSVV